MAEDKIQFDFEIVDKATKVLDDVKKSLEAAQKELKNVAKEGKEAGKGLDKAGEGAKKTAKDTKELAKQNKGLVESFKDMKAGALAAVAALAGITAFAKSSVDAFLEADKAARSYEFILRNLGATTGDLEFANRKMEAALKKTGIGISDQQKALRELTIKLGDPAKAINSLDDALEIAAATGKDLSSVVSALGDVMNGEAEAFKSMGLITQVQAQQISKLDDASQRAAATMELVRQKVQGATGALSEQAVEVANAKEAWGGFKEQSGETILGLASPTLKEVTSILKMISDATGKARDAFKGMKESVSELISPEIMGGLGKLGLVARMINPATAAGAWWDVAAGFAKEYNKELIEIGDNNKKLAEQPAPFIPFGPDISQMGADPNKAKKDDPAAKARAESLRQSRHLVELAKAENAEKRIELELAHQIAEINRTGLSTEDKKNRIFLARNEANEKLIELLDKQDQAAKEAADKRAKELNAMAEKAAKEAEIKRALDEEMAMREELAKAQIAAFQATDEHAKIELDHKVRLLELEQRITTESMTAAEAELALLQIKRQRHEEELGQIEEQYSKIRQSMSILDKTAQSGGKAGGFAKLGADLSGVTIGLMEMGEKGELSAQAMSDAMGAGGQAIAAFAESQGASQMAINALMAATATAQGFMQISSGNIPGAVAAFTSAAIYGANAATGGGGSKATAPAQGIKPQGPSREESFQSMYQAHLKALNEARAEGREQIIYNFAGATFLDGNVSAQRRVDDAMSRSRRLSVGG